MLHHRMFAADYQAQVQAKQCYQTEPEHGSGEADGSICQQIYIHNKILNTYLVTYSLLSLRTIFRTPMHSHPV